MGAARPRSARLCPKRRLRLASRTGRAAGGWAGPDDEATVHRVPDGDTASVEPEIDGEDSVRLFSVDVPEVGEGQPYAAETASFARTG
ncbi:MAG: hypothetical protein M3R38_03320 [Actinomycetota bacterium]|nr:hypothetical protein [Actinomycetota bacterium]